MKQLLGALVVLGAACWLCVYAVALILAGVFVLVAVPQGNELLEWTAARESLAHTVLFHGAVAAWALSAWYCCRALLQRRYPGRFGNPALESKERFPVLLRKWLPRTLGAIVYVSLAAFLFRAGELAEGAVTLSLGVAYWVFVVMRRRFMPSAGAPEQMREKLPPATAVILGLALAASLLLCVGFLVSPVALPRFLGAAPIILLAFTGWILFGSIVLVLLPKSRGWPSLALLPFVLALASGGTDNHEVRQAPVGAAPARAQSLHQSAMQWLEANEGEMRRARRDGRATFPVYIAAAEGGGLRAAYWTASVLGEIEDATGARFSRHLFAVSGVSGGSLGGATFVAGLVGPQAACGSPRETSVRECARAFLRRDFLSPVTAYLLFPDLVQRFIPWPLRTLDRARALEWSWERSWADTHPAVRVNQFAAAYHAIGGARPDGTPLPRLLLNGTRVETGKRVLVSPARFSKDELPEVDDLLAVGGKAWSMPLSAAVHLSARFTYVSPAARICADASETCDDEGVWGRVVDGGYHENSGAQTAASVLRVLRRAAREFAKDRPGIAQIQPQVVIITNDAGSARLCDDARPPAPEHSYTELLSPIRALWNTRTARGAQARRALADAAAGWQRDALDDDCGADGTRENTFELALAPAVTPGAGAPMRQPALGWFLAQGSVALMDDALCWEQHRQVFERMRKDLGVEGEYRCAP